MTRLHTYTVVGRSSFPEDMLRYDSCWPRRQQDIPLPRRHGPTHEVEICGIHEPTVARWESFGWGVKDHKVVKS